MRIVKVGIATIIAIFLAVPSFALNTGKVKLNGNMTVDYEQLPPEASNIQEVFSKGIFYGRLRENAFDWNWNTESSKLKDNKAMGVGGSFIFKSAPLNGFSGTLGLYTSQNPSFYRENRQDVGFAKAGKDTFSRNKVKNGGAYDGDFGMTVLGQAYLQYDYSKTSFILGRQLFESVFTASNDTKMIPNTFDGLTAVSKEIPKTTITLAYFTAQKLRDHINSHDVIAFNSWNENDDAGVNKSLTTNLIGIHNKLFIASIDNKSIKNLRVRASYLSVPSVVSDIALEGYYSFHVAGWSITPGMRMWFQMDELNANTPVADLSANATGYANPDSLNGKLFAERVDFKKGPLMARFGYSTVADEADIIAPWRGFPTGGFTRAMGQYNWRANTSTYMIRLVYDFGKAKMVPGFKVSARYAMQNFDDRKPGEQADSNVLNIDMVKNLSKNFMAKFRVAFVSGDKNDVDMNGATKSDISYNEYRLELNYFF